MIKHFTVQQAVDSIQASSAKPGTSSAQAMQQPEQPSVPMAADLGGADNSQVAQSEMLNTVTQLLQQTQQVCYRGNRPWRGGQQPDGSE